jgi:hypothetical protein
VLQHMQAGCEAAQKHFGSRCGEWAGRMHSHDRVHAAVNCTNTATTLVSWVVDKHGCHYGESVCVWKRREWCGK